VKYGSKLLLSIFFLINLSYNIPAQLSSLFLGAWRLKLGACGLKPLLNFLSMRWQRLTYEGGRSSSTWVKYLSNDFVLILINFGQALDQPSFFTVLISPMTSDQKTCGTTSLFLPT
tara:strand:+ start:620 stop:967 length:348 start_codon:yes stop_codon:yes gene_type:complete